MKAKVKTIEARYEELREAMRHVVAMAEAHVAGDPDDSGVVHVAVAETLEGSATLALSDLLLRAMARIASARWPATRARIAEYGHRLPRGPIDYAGGGDVILVVGSGFWSREIRASRERTVHDPKARELAEAALESLAPSLRESARLATEAWERYRLAVAQGVAVAPGEEGGSS